MKALTAIIEIREMNRNEHQEHFNQTGLKTLKIIFCNWEIAFNSSR